MVITPRSITIELVTDRLEALPMIGGERSRSTTTRKRHRQAAEPRAFESRAADSNMDGLRPTRTPFKPDVTQRGELTGRLAPTITLKRLLAAARRLRWDAQERMLGMR